MKKLLVTGLIVAGLGLLASDAEARGRRGCYYDCCYDCCAPCYTPVIQYVDKVVTVCKPVWKSQKVACVVNRVHYRYEDVPMECTVMVAKWVPVKQQHTYCVSEPKTVVRDVVYCKYVPVQCVDACGCCYTCCKPQTYVQQVKCTVYEPKLVTKDVVVQVCHYEPKVHKYSVRRCFAECKPEKIMVDRHYCEMVHHQVTIQVPVCVGYSCGPVAAAPKTMPPAKDQ